MKQDEMLQLLRAGPKGITAWNVERERAPIAPDLRGVDLSGADLQGANLRGADLSMATLAGADLREARLNDANLERASLIGARVNVGTRFERANVCDCKIERHTLESLNEYGGLTVGDRMLLRVIDGVATLRATYSGFWQWIHLTSLAMFVFPYVAFVLKHWSIAKFHLLTDGPKITLWEALRRYIWNGGVRWEDGWNFNLWPFAAFAAALAYNALRGVLLWKTKTLELRQQASGLPVPFSLTGFWGRAYQAARWGLFVNLAVVLYHTIHFLGQEIPLP